MHAKKSLKVKFRELLENRRTVLVFGDGLNMQAAKQSGFKRIDDWSRVLKSLWKDARGKPSGFDRAKSMAIQWEALIRQWSDAHKTTRRRAEQGLRKALCRHLSALEERQRGKRSLYREIAEAGFENIISFNIDGRLANKTRVKPPGHVPAGKKFLYRRMRLRGPIRHTDVWFPYGHSTDPNSIEFGHSLYDDRIMHLEDYRDGLMRRWYDWNSSYSSYELKHPNVIYGMRLRLPSWFDLFFLSPLVFVGSSLSLDDWPLWWILHQRERNFAYFDEEDCPSTYCLAHADADLGHLAGRPAGIEVVQFNSYESLWNFLLDSIG